MPTRSNKGLWIFGGLSLAFLAAVAAAVIVLPSDHGATAQRRPSAGDAGQSGKPDITEITDAMLVDQSSFPPLYPPTWQKSIGNASPPSQSSPGGQTDPPECRAIVAPPSSDWARVQGTLPDGTKMGVFLDPTPNRIDWHQLVQHCATIKYDDGSAITLEALSPQGLPDWATAFEMSTLAHSADRTLLIRGIYRGVYVDAFCSYNRETPDRTDELVRVFTDQVAKLEAAP